MSDLEEGFGGGEGGTTFTEVENVSWCGRMQEACMGVVIGFLLFFGAGGVLVWNEGRAVRRAKDLEEGAAAVISLASPNNATAASTGQLIWVQGPVQTTQVLQDPLFGVPNGTTEAETRPLKLNRDVQMFQWKETSETRREKTAGGGERRVTTYNYNKVWSPTLIDSGSFNQQEGHQNPSAFPFDPMEFVADPIALGAFALNEDVVSKISWFTAVTDLATSNILDATLRDNATFYNYGFFVGRGSQFDPEIGDTQTEFQQVLPDTVSIVGMAGMSGTNGNATLEEFPTERGGTILLVRRGAFTAAQLFQQAVEENEQLTWILRFVGWLAMFIGIILVLQPVSTFVDVIPFIGDCLEGGLNSCVFPLIAAVISIPCAGICIAIGWLVYRPIIAIPLLIVFVGILGWICVRARNKQEEIANGKPDQNEQPTYNANGSQYNANPSQYNSNGSQYNANPSPYSSNTGKPDGEGEVYVSSPYQPSAVPMATNVVPVQSSSVYNPSAPAEPAPFSQALGS